MKKTVTIVTIPLESRKGFHQNGDLLKLIKLIENNDRFKLGDFTITSVKWVDVEPNKYWQAEQLLVLSDDEILEGDFCTLLDGFGNVILGNPQKYSPDEGHVLNKGLKKTIAAYPTIDGVLPISKETVQTWIDSGTPKKGSVDMLYWCKNGDSLSGCEKQAHCNCSDNTDPDVDTQGNLLLEFGESCEAF